MARANFIALPNEMLNNIARFSNRFRDLSSLARVDRRTYTLLKDYLLRHEVSSERGSSAALAWALTAKNIDEDFRLLIVNKAIDAGVDINMGMDLFSFPGIHGRMPLSGQERLCALGIAVGHGHFRVAQRMLDAGADVNLELTASFSPLRTSIDARHTEAVKFLLEQPGTDLYGHHRRDTSLLERALGSSSAEIVQLIVPRLDLSHSDYSGGIRYLILAVQLQDPDMVSAVLSSKQLAPNSLFVTGHAQRNPESVFTLACRMDNGDVLRLLHNDHRVDVDLDREGYNLGVLQAWRYGHMRHVLFLMRSTRSKTAKGSIFCLAYNCGYASLAKKVVQLACVELAQQV